MKQVLNEQLGTEMGSAMGSFVVISVLGLSNPFGMFVLVFIFASVGGIGGAELFKYGGDKLLSLGSTFTGRNPQIYHSLDQLFGAQLQ